MKIQPKYLSLLTLFTFISLASGCMEYSKKIETTPKMGALVSAKWLVEHINDPDLIVLDSTVVTAMNDKGQFTNISGRATFEAGHIPTASFADLKGNLSDQENSLEFALPSSQQFSKVMSTLGVGENSRVVIYSSKNAVWAARLWWMLRWSGFEQVALLDGGIKAWTDAGGELTTEVVKPNPNKFIFKKQDHLIADRDEVFSAINNSEVTIADALPEAHYAGKFSLYSRPGHIPTAVNMPSSNYLDYGFYKSFDDLDLLIEGDRNKRVITYCGGGIAASSLAFTLVRAGFTDVAIYDGSLEEWTANPENPMTVNIP